MRESQWIRYRSIVLCYLAGRIASPVGAHVITVKFSFGDPASELSRRLSQYGGATDWRMKPHLADRDKYSGKVK
jgi:hypothetical protein